MPTDSATAVNPASGLKAIVDNLGTIIVDPWVSKVGGFIDAPDQQVVFKNRGGTMEMAVAVDYPSVQVLVRSPSYEAGYTMARACLDVLLGIPSGADQYPELTSVVGRGGIQELGRDDKNRELFSFNLQLIVSYDSSGYRDWT